MRSGIRGEIVHSGDGDSGVGEVPVSQRKSLICRIQDDYIGK